MNNFVNAINRIPPDKFYYAYIHTVWLVTDNVFKLPEFSQMFAYQPSW